MTVTDFTKEVARNCSMHQIICELNKATERYMRQQTPQNQLTCLALSSALMQRSIADKVGIVKGEEILDDVMKLYKIIKAPANKN